MHASAPNSANASFASHTAPGRRRHNARPAATPTLVITRRAPRKTKDNVDRELKCARLVAACKARLAGFHTVNSRIKMRSQPPGAYSERLLNRARESENGDEFEEAQRVRLRARLAELLRAMVPAASSRDAS